MMSFREVVTDTSFGERLILAVATATFEETALLARRNAALEDFAALVAHELKGPLEAARLEPRSSTELGRAIELVDAILDTVRSEADGAAAVPDRCLEDALRDLGSVPATVDAALPPELPVAPTLLRVILRNLVANAVAAGAGAVHIEASALPESWSLNVED